ncbi:hypothetical protein AMK59_7363 [Oryctes borbonicus]|uniref:Uncharacterized protein n=1 Tax=Oryctes borbonicus TaxID=1629725 RepID=A0A0T6AZ62_9SCAR|nr:hypothetical protein AMK59_7363 [Oryctes borbonicus]
MTSKNVLDINQTLYSNILKRIFRHDLYINTFNTAQKIKEGNPTLNDFTTDVETLNISLPYPVSEPRDIENVIDNCNKPVLDKEKYNGRIESFLSRYKKDKRRVTKKYVKETKYGSLPKYLFDLAVENIKDPDTYFEGNYNWYYTGGILDKCRMLGEEYLIFADHGNVLSLRNATGKGFSVKIDGLDESPIFNINTNCNGNPIVCLRQRHKIYAMQLNLTDDEINLILLTSKTSPTVPFIDVKYHNGEVSFLDLNRQLSIEYIEEKKCEEFTLKSTTESNLFGQIEYKDDNTLITLDRNSMRIFDKRSKEEKVHIYKNNCFNCDELCIFTLSKDPNYIFMSSRHNILKLDLRQLDIVKTWSHMLAYPPSMMKIEDYNSNELIFVSSHSYKDRVVLLSHGDESNLVQLVPNNIDTWNKCNRIYNFNLFNNNVMRLKYSTIGISLFQNYEGLDLYTCNSVGDVFKNTIFHSDNSSSTEPLQHINKWINSLSYKPKELIISHVREFSHVKDILDKPEKNTTLDRYTQPNKKRLDFISDMTLEDVDMAAIWLSEERPKDEDLLPSTSTLVKVTEWLNQHDDEISEEDVKIK